MNFINYQSLVCLTDLQNVNITLRILFRPQPHILPQMYMNLGEDYDERVLPSITTEVLKAVVVSRNHTVINWYSCQYKKIVQLLIYTFR